MNTKIGPIDVEDIGPNGYIIIDDTNAKEDVSAWLPELERSELEAYNHNVDGISSLIMAIHAEVSEIDIMSNAFARAVEAALEACGNN